MKIKMIDKNVALPNCWKSCGASYGDWEELQSGKEIEVTGVAEQIDASRVKRVANKRCL